MKFDQKLKNTQSPSVLSISTGKEKKRPRNLESKSHARKYNKVLSL
jgi:hypothetical protein